MGSVLNDPSAPDSDKSPLSSADFAEPQESRLDGIVSDDDDVGLIDAVQPAGARKMADPVYNYSITREPYTAVKDVGDNDAPPAIHLMHSDSEALDRVRNPDDNDLLSEIQKDYDGLQMVRARHASAHMLASDRKAMWKQHVQVPEVNRKLSQVYVAADHGQNPVQRIIDQINSTVTGTMPAYVPLYNSGLWLRIAPITLPQINEFMTSHSENTHELGYATDGQVFSAISGVFQKAIVEFILKSVVMSSADIPLSELPKYIKQDDYQALVAGAAGTIFSRGFTYRHRCISSTGAMAHVTTGVLNPRDVVWYDENKITQEAAQHMNEAYDSIRRAFSAQRAGRQDFYSQLMPVEKVVAYQKKHDDLASSSFACGSYSGKLRSPTIHDMAEHTEIWVNQMKDSVAYRELKRLEASDGNAPKRRQQFLARQSASAELARLSMYFESFSLEQENGELVTTDTRDGVLSVLNSLSASRVLGNDEALTRISECVTKFAANTSNTLTGIPSFTCPECGVPQAQAPVNEGDENNPLRSLVPLQPDVLFFRLVLWVYQKTIAE